MNPVLHELLRTGATATPSGSTIPLQGNVSADEVALLLDVLGELQPAATLEVGLAYGVSALAICSALNAPGARHIVIDPEQNAKPLWDGIGLFNLRRAGFERLISFYELPSYRVLPVLEAEGLRVDFAFIDGWHTFDAVLLDFLYIDKMLPVGGLVVFDDADWPSIRRVLRFIVTNLPYHVHKTLPPVAAQKSGQRRVYEGGLRVAGAALRGASRIPGLKKPIARAFGGELLGVDRAYNLAGACIALRKVGEDRRSYDHFVEF